MIINELTHTILTLKNVYKMRINTYDNKYSKSRKVEMIIIPNNKNKWKIYYFINQNIIKKQFNL